MVHHQQVPQVPGGWPDRAGPGFSADFKGITLSILYKRRPIRDGRQIVEKNKRQGLAFSKKLRDSAHWGPEAVEAEFALEAI